MKRVHVFPAIVTICAVGLGIALFTGQFKSNSAKKLILSQGFPTVDSTLFQKLESEDMVDLTIEWDFKQFMKGKMSNNYQPAVLSYMNKDSFSFRRQIEIKPRGKMRREVCYYPPLKVKLSKKDLANEGLLPFNNLEIVINCRSNGQYEQFVLREYIAYKLYNLLTDNSYRVQLAKFRFVDTGKKNKDFESIGYLIEDNDELEHRQKGKIVKPRMFSPEKVEADNYELFCVFQFMIGNTDWYVYNLHNVKIMGVEGQTQPYVVPYDFDYSGFVKTPYSIPHEKLGIKDVTERFYQGLCRNKEQTEKTLQIFRNKKEEIMTMVAEFPHFNDHSRKHTIDYLESFYEIVENDKKKENMIFEHCDKWMIKK
jgi:hypothetical protein